MVKNDSLVYRRVETSIKINKTKILKEKPPEMGTPKKGKLP